MPAISVLYMDQHYTMQGVVFDMGTEIWYCDDNGTPGNTLDNSGGKLFRGGTEIHLNDVIPGNN